MIRTERTEHIGVAVVGSVSEVTEFCPGLPLCDPLPFLMLRSRLGKPVGTVSTRSVLLVLFEGVITFLVMFLVAVLVSSSAFGRFEIVEGLCYADVLVWWDGSQLRLLDSETEGSSVNIRHACCVCAGERHHRWLLEWEHWLHRHCHCS